MWHSYAATNNAAVSNAPPVLSQTYGYRFDAKRFAVLPNKVPEGLSSVFANDWFSLEFLRTAPIEAKTFFIADKLTSFIYGTLETTHVDCVSKLNVDSPENTLVGFDYGVSFFIKLCDDEVKNNDFFDRVLNSFWNFCSNHNVPDHSGRVTYLLQQLFVIAREQYNFDVIYNSLGLQDVASQVKVSSPELIRVYYSAPLDHEPIKKDLLARLNEACESAFKTVLNHKWKPKSWKFNVLNTLVKVYVKSERTANEIYQFALVFNSFRKAIMPSGDSKEDWIERVRVTGLALRDFLQPDAKAGSNKCHASINNAYDEWFPTADDGRNVLLIGPSGAGKSTLINSMVNYFKYDKLADAAGQELSSVLPCKFAVQDDDYGFHTVTLGQDENECFNELGQSVTQVPQLHRLEYGDLTLNLIDTPGLCDSRGVEQDEANVAAICEAIRRAGKLHAICFVMLPNESKMSAGLEYVLTKLLSIFSPKVFPNVCFFFTNSCGTFFRPGDSVQPIKKLMQLTNKQHHNSFVFGKENVFCVDSDAFRYLVVKQQNPKLAYGKFEDFEHNWSKSHEAIMNFVKFVATRKLASDFFAVNIGSKPKLGNQNANNFGKGGKKNGHGRGRGRGR